jgi:uncharacterized membrane protein
MAFVLLIVAIGGLSLSWIGVAGLTGRLHRNRFAGIRTAFTMRSEENWKAVHQAAGPIFIFGGILVTATELAFLPFAFAGKLSTIVQVIVAAGGAGIMLGTALAGLYAGTSFAAARDISNSSGRQG